MKTLRILNKIARHLSRFIGMPLFILASFVPKDKNLWLFGAWNGRKYLDNPKYIFEQVLKEWPQIKAIWICKDRCLRDELRSKGLPADIAVSPRAIWYQMRAGAVVFTHSVAWEFLPYCVGISSRRVQTWHGMPIKKIGFDDTRTPNARWRERIYTFFIPYMTERCDLVLAGGPEDRDRYRSAFNVRSENVRITGYPRNDRIQKAVATHEGGFRAIYMPTFRGAVGSEFLLLEESGFDFAKMDEVLHSNDIILFMKIHPVQCFSIRDIENISRCDNIKIVKSEGDIYETIGSYDALITDFSGIFFDFMVSGKPIIMAPFNLDSYLANDRQLYYSYDDICPSEKCLSWEEVLKQLVKLKSEGFVPDERYKTLQRRFHTYLDCGSSQRAAYQIADVTGCRR